MKFCIDCIHYVEGEPATCEKTRLEKPSLVDGKTRVTYLTCEENRKFTGKFMCSNCGPSGLYWEQR